MVKNPAVIKTTQEDIKWKQCVSLTPPSPEATTLNLSLESQESFRLSGHKHSPDTSLTLLDIVSGVSFQELPVFDLRPLSLRTKC